MAFFNDAKTTPAVQDAQVDESNAEWSDEKLGTVYDQRDMRRMGNKQELRVSVLTVC